MVLMTTRQTTTKRTPEIGRSLASPLRISSQSRVISIGEVKAIKCRAAPRGEIHGYLEVVEKVVVEERNFARTGAQACEIAHHGD
jgi:hypothetical protein